MSEARRCEAPGCGKIGEPPFRGWWKLANESDLVYVGERLEMDACSWECVGAIVFDRSAEMQRVADVSDELG